MIDDEDFFTSNIMRDAQAEHLRTWNEDNPEAWWHQQDQEAQQRSEEESPDTTTSFTLRDLVRAAKRIFNKKTT
tara:strand:- start:627 stop:848 length:222 start_codon:yes stop_codon:yes gene_type:complete